MNKAQHTTQYIKHLAESANFKGGAFNKHCNGLIGNRFKMPNVSYTQTLYNMLRKTNTKNKYNGKIEKFNWV